MSAWPSVASWLLDLDLHERQALGDRRIDVAQRQLIQAHFDPGGAGDLHRLGRSAGRAGGSDEMLLMRDRFGNVELNAERLFEREVPDSLACRRFVQKLLISGSFRFNTSSARCNATM